MTGKNVTRADLVDAVCEKVGLSRLAAVDLVSQVLGEITDTLAAGENVKLSSFGIFNVRDKRNQVGRNPKTGVTVPIETRQIIVFIASRVLKAHVNGAAKKSVRRRRVKRASVLEA